MQTQERLRPDPIQRQNTKMDSFFQQVYRIVAQIPYGKVASYGQIAWLLGNPRLARQVGWAMRQCSNELPWQRVVKADGAIAGGAHAQIRRGLLEAEGIAFLPDGRVNMAVCQWQGPTIG